MNTTERAIAFMQKNSHLTVPQLMANFTEEERKDWDTEMKILCVDYQTDITKLQREKEELEVRAHSLISQAKAFKDYQSVGNGAKLNVVIQELEEFLTKTKDGK